MSVTCSKCGRESELEEHYIEVPKNFRLGCRKLCPACVDRKKAAEEILGLVLTVAVVLLAGALFTWQPSPVGLVAVNFLCFTTVVSFAVIAVHELGHAVAAWVCGFKVFAIRVGEGARLLERKQWGIRWSVHALPGTGVCITGPPTLNHFFRRR